MRVPIVTIAVLASIMLPRTAAAQPRGVQFTPDGTTTLVNKDVGGDRWAISLNQDGTVTGNVFRSGADPAFIFCDPVSGTNRLRCSGAGACTASGTRRGIQRTPDAAHVLVNKDVGGDRWAISLNQDGTVTGNVFRSGGGPPAFLFCRPWGEGILRCSGADACPSSPCANTFTFIADIVLPSDFFEVPEPCGVPFDFIAEVTPPSDFFAPPNDERRDTEALAESLRTQAEGVMEIGIALIGSATTAATGELAFPAGQVTIPCRDGGFYVETDDSIEAFDCLEDGVVTNGLATFAVNPLTGVLFLTLDTVSVREVSTGEETTWSGELASRLDGDLLVTRGDVFVDSNSLGTFDISFADFVTDPDGVAVGGGFSLEVMSGEGALADVQAARFEILGLDIERVEVDLANGETVTFFFAPTLCDPCVSGASCAAGLGCFPCDDQCIGAVSRCSLPDTFIVCIDGVF